MTKRSKITLFGLLALIAAFGLILTGCPDPNSSSSTTTVTEWRDKPSVQIADVVFNDSDGSAAATLTFNVVLPEGNAWVTAAVEALGSADIDALFAVTTHESAQATVDGWIVAGGYEAEIDTENPGKLNVTLSQDSAEQTGISKVSVRLNSFDIADLIADNPPLNMSLQTVPAAPYTGALITVTDVTFVDGTAASASEVYVTLKLSSGAWDSGLSGDNVKSLLKLGTGPTEAALTLSGLASLPETPSDTVTVKMLGADSTWTGYGTITAWLDGSVDISSDFITGDEPARVDLDSKYATPTVTLASTKSHGVPGYQSITGLTATGVKYLVLKDGTDWYKVVEGGTLASIALTESAADGTAALGSGVTSIRGLSNDSTYDVYQWVTSSSNLDAPGGSKNMVLNVTGNVAITLAASEANGNTIVFVFDTITNGTGNIASGSTDMPSSGGTIKTDDHTWTFAIVSSSPAAVVNWTEGETFCTVTGGVTGTTFTLTRS